MKLIAGLGNPGDKYENTRHNIGFMVVDYMAEAANAVFTDTKWEAKVAKIVVANDQVLLVKPQTFMNESGRAVGKIANFYRIVPEDVIVIHDELDLDLGKIKVVINRGAGGHNGVSSIIAHLGSKNFIRVRIGIGRPELPMPISRYVLSQFAGPDRELMAERVRAISDGVRLILEKGHSDAMGQLNGL